MKQEFKKVYDLMKEANAHLNSRNYGKLSQTLIDLKVAATTLKSQDVKTDDIEQLAQVDLMVVMAERLIEDVVTGLQYDKRDLLAFAFELLKNDVQ